MKDLALIVADKNMDFALRGILARPRALQIRDITFKTSVHVGHDGGIRTSGSDVLAREREEFRHGLLILDWEGSGTDLDDPESLEAELDSRLAKSGWGKNAKAIVVQPELDVWIWGSDNLMSELVEWQEEISVRHWLKLDNYEFDSNQKPLCPKAALESIMFHQKKPRSSKLYQQAMSKISLNRCTDPAFNRLKTALQTWFPVTAKE